MAAIRCLKNGKAPVQDSLCAELFKADPQFAAKSSLPTLRSHMGGKQLPEDWTEGVIVKIPKKGALSYCNIWRGISLLSSHRASGFLKGKGCIEQIFTLRNIIEQYTELQRQLYINFVYFEKAFDSVLQDSLSPSPRPTGSHSRLSMSSRASSTTSHAGCRTASPVLKSRLVSGKAV